MTSNAFICEKQLLLFCVKQGLSVGIIGGSVGIIDESVGIEQDKHIIEIKTTNHALENKTPC